MVVGVRGDGERGLRTSRPGIPRQHRRGHVPVTVVAVLRAPAVAARSRPAVRGGQPVQAVVDGWRRICAVRTLGLGGAFACLTWLVPEAAVRRRPTDPSLTA